MKKDDCIFCKIANGEIPTNSIYEDEKFNGLAYKITFEEPQRAVAPGQSVVLYIDGTIFGGGIINKTL